MTFVLCDDRIQNLGQEGTVDAQQLAMTRCTAQQTAQNVAAAFVRRNDAVADHHSGRTDVVGDNAQRDVDLLILVILDASDALDVLHDVADGIDLEQRANALYNTSQTLQTHTGIDVLLLELGVVAVAVVVELREYVIPDFHVAVAVTANRAVGLVAAILFAAIVVDLRARAARTRAMLPEVVGLAKAENALSGDADFLVPDFKCLVVINVDGRIETIGVDANPLGRGQEFPAPVNGFTLEVVTEGEVTQHLEVGAVTCGLADVLDVAGTNALLAGGDTMTRGLLLTGEVGLHRCHTGIDEQQGRIVLRNQRKAGQTQVTLALEE